MPFSLSGLVMRPIRAAAIVAIVALLSGLLVLPSPAAGEDICGIDDIVAAVQNANRVAPDPWTFASGPGCIYTYTGPDTFVDSDSGASAVPELTGHLIIAGGGITITRAGDAPKVRIFSIAATGNLELQNVTISNGSWENGGGIFNGGGQLTLSNSTITGNLADGGFGGGIASFGTTVIHDSTINSNTGTIGGGIANLGGSMTIDSSTVDVNGSDFGPAEIYNSGPTLGDGTLTLVNSTVVGRGGGTSDIGVLNDGTFNAYNSTISLNAGGGINNQGGSESSPAVTTLANTIVANNGASNCDSSQTSVGGIVDGGYNLDSDDTCGFSTDNHSLSNTDPGFSPVGLSYQDGPTQLLPLTTTSPAIDAGNDDVCAGSLVNGLDQRGVARPQGAHCDIGAFEVLSPIVTANDATAQDVDSSVSLSASAAFVCGETFTGCPESVTGTISFSVTDSSNNPVGTAVSGTLSNGSASATFDPSGLAPGTYTITATYHDPSNTYADATDTSTLVVTSGPAASVTLAPGDTTATVGQTVTEVLTVHDLLGYPVADGTLVDYSVTGSNLSSGTRSTVNGQATISYSGSFAGTDTLTATVQSGTDPQATATISWNAPVSTLRGSLTIMSLFGSQIQAVVNTGSRGGAPSGSFTYSDRSVRLSNVRLTSLVVSGSNATLYGTANLANGSSVSFHLDVSASRSGGTFRLQLSNGYDSGRLSAPVVRVSP